jgi:hypothetical protein
MAAVINFLEFISAAIFLFFDSVQGKETKEILPIR